MSAIRGLADVQAGGDLSPYGHNQTFKILPLDASEPLRIKQYLQFFTGQVSQLRGHINNWPTFLVRLLSYFCSLHIPNYRI